MSRSPSVEVLIVSYNTRDLLAECLASIETHKPPASIVELNVRVLDNASSDGSAEMIGRQFPAATLERSSKNLGFARANNKLANSSGADYLMLLNPDTRWTQDLIEPLLRALQASPQAVAVGPLLKWPDGRPQPSAQGFPTVGYEFACALRGRRIARFVRRLWNVDQVIDRVERPGIALSERRVTPVLWATCWFMRRADVVNNGLFDERFFTYDEDVDFCRRMRAHGRTFVLEPRVSLIHVGSGSSSESVKRDLTRRGRHLYYRLHHGRTAAFAFAKGLPALLRADAARARIMRR